MVLNPAFAKFERKADKKAEAPKSGEFIPKAGQFFTWSVVRNYGVNPGARCTVTTGYTATVKFYDNNGDPEAVGPLDQTSKTFTMKDSTDTWAKVAERANAWGQITAHNYQHPDRKLAYRD